MVVSNSGLDQHAWVKDLCTATVVRLLTGIGFVAASLCDRALSTVWPMNDLGMSRGEL